MRLIRALWRGEESLVFTFWVFGVVLSIIMLALIYLMLLINPFQAVMAELAASIFLQIITISFITVCVGRSANNYYIVERERAKWKVVWVYLAILSIVAFTIWLAFADWILFVMSIDHHH